MTSSFNPAVLNRAGPATTCRLSSSDGPPTVVVLARAVTGLDVVRSLGRAGIRSHAIHFTRDDPVRLSRYCSSTYFDDSAGDQQALLDYIISTARRLGGRPMVVPCSDAHVMMLARHRESLESYCRVAAANYEDLIEVVSKERLYAHAKAAGLETIPAVVAPNFEEASRWTLAHPAPYLVKPFYVGIPSSRMTLKNLTFPSRVALLNYVSDNSMDSLIVQRLIQGGDGYIFDCYGYCGPDGQVIAMATKRRWHQEPPDFGTCTFGEIPAHLDGNDDTADTLMANTRRLFAQVHYHGIFGVEWLCDRETRKFYLIDFNARPFMSIAHVAAAGLNLAELAYADLVRNDLRTTVGVVQLKHVFGLDLLRDTESFLARRQQGRSGMWEWLRSIAKSRHFYYASWHDPAPGVARLLELLDRGGRHFLRPFLERRRPDGSQSDAKFGSSLAENLADD